MVYKYLLDTNVISEYRKVEKGRADVNFTQWQQSVRLENLYISTITIMELNIGVLKLARKDKVQSQLIHDWLHKILPLFEERTLAFDTKSAFICSELHVPDPRSERDAMIASIALANDLSVVTRNIKDFANMNMHDKLINPFA